MTCSRKGSQKANKRRHSMQTIGTDALMKAKFVMVSGITFRCTLVYKLDGDPVDLTGWRAYMDFFRDGEKAIDLDGCLALGSDGSVQVHIPPSLTSELESGKYDYDIVLEDENGDTVRLAMGTAVVNQRLSYDG